MVRERMACAGAHLLKGGGGACVGPAVIRCGSCGALYYCSQKHQKAHWMEEHAEACARMTEQMQCAPILNDFPFSFTRQTTYMVDMGVVTVCSFLESSGVHSEGLWKSVCDCMVAKSFNGIGVEVDGWHLPSSLCPCREPETPLEYFLTDWTSYYEWRHLPLESPVALLLQWPLSLFYALSLLQSRNGVAFPFGDNQILRIHYLGPERELSQLSVFGELLALLPGLQIYIDFIGPSVPISRDGESLKLDGYAKCLDSDCPCKNTSSSGNPRCELQGDRMAVSSSKGQICLRFWAGLYHDRHFELGTLPHLIFAANAGIAAFPSWRPTIELIKALQVPAFFTDYCEEAAFLALQSVTALTHASLLSFDVRANPFRQPLAPSNKELDLPTFSNGFIFGFN